MKVVQLIYASRPAVPMPLSALLEIINRAQINNAKVGITGVMTFSEASFLQILEGPRDAVNRLYARLIQDPRHQDLTLLGYNETERRRFAEWSMGFFVPDGDSGGDFDPFALSSGEAFSILSASEVLSQVPVPAI